MVSQARSGTLPITRSPRGARPLSRTRFVLKKELVGDFKNGGRELRRKGEPEPVRVHDFEIKGLGKVAPYGVYYIAANQGWVSVGIDADTAHSPSRACRWWQWLGKARYPHRDRPDHGRLRRQQRRPLICGNANCNASPTKRASP